MLILLAKMGKQKLREAIFSVRCLRRFFFRVHFVGQKRGATHSPPQERFTFARHAVVSKVQKRHSLPKSDRNALRNPDFGL